MTNTNQGIGVARAMNPAESAHTRRVAAWCAEVSAKLDLPAAERMILEQVVPLHQRTKLVVDEQVWNALRCELGFVPERAAEPSPQDSIMDSIMEVLQSFHGIRPASE